jgi:hypothetical protein
MFKAKLISSPKYYSLKSKLFWLSMLSATLIGSLVNYYKFPIWLSVLMAILYILVHVYIYRNQKLVDLMVGQKRIEVDTNEIRIQSAKGNQQEKIMLEDVDQIVIQDKYELGQDMNVRPKKNFFIISQKNTERKFEFEMDSHYMINQLNKVIESWSQKGKKIERVL